MRKTFRISLFFGVLAMMLTATMTSCGDDKDEPTPPPTSKYEMVDLSLPSGTKWAAYNVGATKPEEAGSYFAFGETKPETGCSESTYFGNVAEKDPLAEYYGKSIAGTKWDAATAIWGAGYTIPTDVQINELVDNCTKEITTVNGVKGAKFTSKINSKSIFVPFGGLYYEGKVGAYNEYGGFWTARLVDFGSANLYDVELNFCAGSRYYGVPVRAVSK